MRHFIACLPQREFQLALSRCRFLDPVPTDFHIACSHTESQRATTRLLLQCFLRALTEQRQLQFAHGAFHAQQQPIVGMARIIDSILVDDDGADQSTELN